MSVTLVGLLYLSLGLAVFALRLGQRGCLADALFCALFWPLDLLRRWIEVLVGVLLSAEREGEGA